MTQDAIQITEDNQQAKSCAYCHNPLEIGQSAVACCECGTAHHRNCWETNEGCAALNCGCQEHVNLPVPDLARVESVQVIIGEGTLPHISISENELAPSPPHIVLDISDLPQPAAPPRPETPEVSCAYCHHRIEADQQAVACRRCGTPYHQECWKATNRCALLGCKSRQYVTHRVGQQASQEQETAVVIEEQRRETLMDKIRRVWRFFTE